MGAQLRVYRQKIKSAQTTKKITRAMELIAASRIQKAKARVEASNPYNDAITRAVSAVATHSKLDHPLVTEAENIQRAAVVIFTSDRGLAGAFNSQVLREFAVGKLEIKKRGVDVVPEQLRRSLKLRGSRQATLIITRFRGGRIALLADRI